MPATRSPPYGRAVHSRLTDFGVAAIPFTLGLVGPGTNDVAWSLPLGAGIGASLYWRRRYPAMTLAACFALGLIQLAAFGTGFGWATGKAFLRAQGGPVSFPVLQIVGYVVLASVAALLASVIPARRAARLTVIDGLAAD